MLSAVIPALNEGPQMAGAVAAARQAGFDEIVVVDGRSTDDTVLQSRDADRVLRSPPGRARQQNLGAAFSRGDVVCFLHADCRPGPGAAESMRRALADPQVVGGCFSQRIDAPGWLYRLIEDGNLLRVFWFGLIYGDQGIFLRRRVFDDLGGFPEWPLMEDVELSCRLRGKGRLVVLRDRLLVSARRWERRGIVRQTLRNWTLLTLFFAGVPAEQLVRGYPHVR
jgi:rSAM/selenodomain-associated transferase 2